MKHSIQYSNLFFYLWCLILSAYTLIAQYHPVFRLFTHPFQCLIIRVVSIGIVHPVISESGFIVLEQMCPPTLAGEWGLRERQKERKCFPFDQLVLHSDTALNSIPTKTAGASVPWMGCTFHIVVGYLYVGITKDYNMQISLLMRPLYPHDCIHTRTVALI